MISFVTLLLGLITGAHPVELAVTGGVATVELRLDGRTVARLDEAPWVASCDLGPVLAPHKLEALAFDAEGKPLGAARQWVNLPRREAEAGIVLERDPAGRAVAARVTSVNLEFAEPESVELLFDGKRLPTDAAGRVPLPADLGQAVHLLSATVLFPRHVVATAELAFGGENTERAETELTAVPIVAHGWRRPPALETLQGRFAVAGRPARVLAVEDGPAEVVVVRDTTSATFDLRTRHEMSRRPSRGALGPDDALRFLDPRGRSTGPRPRKATLFDISQRFFSKDGGLLWLVASTSDRFLGGGEQSLADAVATAALGAMEGNRPRAVVLLLGRAENERSHYDVKTVREYLEMLHVPLVVWSASPGELPQGLRDWGPPDDVRTPRKMEKAAARLKAALDAQQIVWLQGLHLPQEVTLVEDPNAPLRFAGAGGQKQQ